MFTVLKDLFTLAGFAKRKPEKLEWTNQVLYYANHVIKNV